jgi:hypothetical protein
MANPLIEVGTGESRLSKLLGTGEEIDRLARDSGFVRRTPRKLAAEHFLAGLLQAAATGQRSLRWLALWCGLCCCQTVSRQNLFKRFSDKSNAFLQACVALVMTRASTGGLPEVLLSLPGVLRVLAADSCVLPLHSSLAAVFPGAANQTKRLYSAAKVQCVLDLLTGAFVDFALGCFRDNDQKAASDILPVLRAGDLVLRDLGYFVIGSFTAIAARGAFFLTRLRHGITLLDACGQPIDLLAALRSRVEEPVVEIAVRAGAAGKLAARLVAVRLDEATTAGRVRRARAERDKRLKHSAQYEELLGWSIMLTNLPAGIGAERIVPLYALRWRVEIVFKSWKSHLHLRQPAPAKTGAAQVRGLLHASLIVAILTTAAHALAAADRPSHACAGKGPQPLSLLKTLPLIVLAMQCVFMPPLDLTDEIFLRQLDYHCRYDSRKRPNFVQKLRKATSCALG